MLLNGQAATLAVPPGPGDRAWERVLAIDPTLEPALVEWLMGWPIGPTAVAATAWCSVAAYAFRA